ncbi:MAG TPA: hypothetical protein VED01_28305 [Burkholderiales bacterium]|nr:hypothetical protein [Burkholderiales bacterium]
MSASAEEHVIYRIATAPLRPYPFPHIYVENVFPAAYYAALRSNWPQAHELVSLESTGRVSKGAYPERFVMPLHGQALATLPQERRAFWQALAQWMLDSDRLRSAVIARFEPHVRERFGGTLEDAGLSHEVLVLRDHTNYNLGPHTDSPSHVVSLLFYCPDDDAHAHLGTSIYVPVDPSFRCAGGPHYPHEHFQKMATMEYRPNALFAFMKTDRSFHGVDRIGDADVLRDLILYDIQADPADERAQNRPARAAGGNSLAMRMLKNMLGRKS